MSMVTALVVKGHAYFWVAHFGHYVSRQAGQEADDIAAAGWASKTRGANIIATVTVSAEDMML